jgi:uncharacterized protein
MKKYMLLISLLISSATYIYAQKSEVNPNGYNKFYFPSGQLASEGTLRDGQPDGFWKSYFPNGKLKTEGNRKNYKLDSTWVFYNEKGDTTEVINYLAGSKNGYYFLYKISEDSLKRNCIVSKELYINDVKQGESYYYTNCKLNQQIPYKNGKKHGLGREFDANGNIISLLSFHNNYLVNKERINRVDNNGNKQGKWKEFYQSFQVKTEADYINNQLDGYLREYDVRGNLTKTERYVKGQKFVEKEKIEVKVVVENTFFSTGKIRKTGGYINKKPVGMHVTYTEDGKVASAEMYSDTGYLEAKGITDQNNRFQGNWEFFYPSGKTKAKGNYVDGKRNGEWVFYFESGKIEQKGTYQAGKIQGTWTWFYESGAVLRTEEYNRGLEDGIMVEFAEDGHEMTKGKFVDGEKQGDWFYLVGDDREEGRYRNGAKTGVWKQYYSTGKLKSEGSFVEGEPNGKHQFFNEKGLLVLQSHYRAGRKEKEWLYFNDDGVLEMTVSYKNDQEVKIDGKNIDAKKEAKK